MTTTASTGVTTAARTTATAIKIPLWVRIAKITCLVIGAFGFLFPFYYMLVASFQTTKDATLGGLIPWPSNLSFANYDAINGAINLGRSLINSAIFTGGVLVCTMLFGVIAGYALATLRYRGRGTLFALMLLVQTVPFQLLMVPLYVMTVRNFGLSDSYLGMILPFAINSTAVLIFRAYFLQVPKDLFNAARIDGAGEFRVLWSVALPLVRPALLTATLLTFIGPWNEFLWPFLVTKQQTMQPLAVSLANYTDNAAAAQDNPFGVALAGAVVLALPAVVLFVFFQRHFTSTDLGSGVKG
ncbi:carbohydrate ABC transporter permease [Cellulomonas sp. KRMCY2]|uniref:carbohydrate ABC transporter permease n=1 Tax=Cellulomonas sp. KRMCY2 TaxID=1304865 RepID=UPI0004B6FFF6